MKVIAHMHLPELNSAKRLFLAESYKKIICSALLT